MVNIKESTHFGTLYWRELKTKCSYLYFVSKTGIGAPLLTVIPCLSERYGEGEFNSFDGEKP